MKTQLSRRRIARPGRVFRGFQLHVWCTAYLLGVGLSFTVTPGLAQGNGEQTLSEPQVVKMLDRHTPQAAIKKLVLQRHIDFGVTKDLENDLKKNHGASDDLINALKESQPQSQSLKDRSGTPPLPNPQDPTFHEVAKTVPNEPTSTTIKDLKFVRELGQETPDYNSIHSLAFSADGKLLATGSGDNTVRIWDAGSGQQLQKLVGTAHDVYSVSFNRDATVLASAGGDGIVRLWDVATGKMLKLLRVGRLNTYVALAHNSGAMAVGTTDQTLLLYSDLPLDKNASPPRKLGAPVDNTDEVRVQFNPDDSILASANGTTISLWDTKSGTLLRKIAWNGWSPAFSPDGKLLASSSLSQTPRIRIFNVVDGKEVRTLKLKGVSGNTISVAFSPDGKYLASGGPDQQISIWNMTDGALVNTLREPTKGQMAYRDVVSVAFTPNQGLLAAGSSYNTVSLWSTQ